MLPESPIQAAIEDQKKTEGPRRPWPPKAMRVPVRARPHTAVYKMHRFYARRPHNLFAELIKHYSRPGDIILDPFCGGGVTVVEGLALRRKVVAVDLNPLATFITRMEVAPVDLPALERAFEEVESELAEAVGPLYRATCEKCGNDDARALWYEWSNVVKCPGLCGKSLVLAQVTKLRAGTYRCPTCKVTIKPIECARLPDEMQSLYVVCSKCGEEGERATTCEDIALAESIAKTYGKTIKAEKLFVPSDPFPDGDLEKDHGLFKKGIGTFADFFTRRNLLANARLRKIIKKKRLSPELTELLFLAFSSGLSYTSKLSVKWGGENAREWRAHAYWMPYIYIEYSLLRAFGKRSKAVMRGKKFGQKHLGRFPAGADQFRELHDDKTCLILTQSAHDLPTIPDGSIDVIITDPPFGGNVQYAELSDFYVVWLREVLGCKGLIDNTMEAIETRHRGFPTQKDRQHYEDMLFRVFSECHRVLKPGAWMVLTFHNREPEVWFALHRAANRAGFKLPTREEESNRGMVYQPPIELYTPTFHQRAAGSMLGDFVLSFRRQETPRELIQIREYLTTNEETDLAAFIEELIRYHGGADEAQIVAAVAPFLHERDLWFPIARYDFRQILRQYFVFDKSTRKWYTPEMVDAENIPMVIWEMTPAEEAVRGLLEDLLTHQKEATLDDIMVKIYTTLENSYRPGYETVQSVLSKFSTLKERGKGKRGVFVLKKGPLVRREKAEAQENLFTTEERERKEHNRIILHMAERALALRPGANMHVGETEQRKDPRLKEVSVPLRGSTAYGLPKEAREIIKEIDLLVLARRTIIAAVEVTTSIGTLNKAVNDRFRNLLTACPNLNINLAVVVRDADREKAHKTIFAPANVECGLSTKVMLFSLSDLDKPSTFQQILQIRR